MGEGYGEGLRGKKKEGNLFLLVAKPSPGPLPTGEGIKRQIQLAELAVPQLKIQTQTQADLARAHCARGHEKGIEERLAGCI